MSHITGLPPPPEASPWCSTHARLEQIPIRTCNVGLVVCGKENGVGVGRLEGRHAGIQRRARGARAEGIVVDDAAATCRVQ